MLVSCVDLLAASNKLASIPVWLKPGKAFTLLNKNEQFYFIKFKEKIDQKSNLYIMAFLVYSFSPSQNKWTVWDYNSKIRDFQQIRSITNIKPSTIINLNYTKASRKYDNYDINKMYKVFIKSKTAVHLSDFKGDTKNTLVYPKNYTKKIYFTVNELSSQRLINYNPKDKRQNRRHSIMEGAVPAVYFDSTGYGIFTYNKTQRKEIEKKVFPPDISNPKISKPVKKIEILPDKQITRNGSEYTYFRNFGYVHMNSFCFHSEKVSPHQDYIVTTIISKRIIYSPVTVVREVFYFYTPYKYNVIHYLWLLSDNHLQPLGNIIYNINQLSYEFKQNNRVLLKNLSINARSILLKWDEAIKSYSHSPLQEKEIIREYLCKSNPTINSIFDNFIKFQQDINQNLLTDISTHVNSSFIQLSSQSAFQKIKGKWFFIININSYSQPEQIAIPKIRDTMRPFELVINDDGDKDLYSRILLYNNLFYDNVPKWHYQKMQQKQQSISTNKLWIILDDYVDPEHLIAKRLFDFKKSYRIYQILFNNANLSRIDLIKGSTAIKKPLFDRSILDSSDTRFSEIMALSDLEKHSAQHMNDPWELHLFLARKTSSFHPDTVYKIANRLNKMNVKQLVVWEFCDYKSIEETLYYQLFEQISNKMNINFIYKQIISKNDFYSIKMKGYEHEI